METATKFRSPESKLPPNQQRSKSAELSDTVCTFCTDSGEMLACLPAHAHLRFSSWTLVSPPSSARLPSQRHVTFSPLHPFPPCLREALPDEHRTRGASSHATEAETQVQGSLGSSCVSAATSPEAGDREVWFLHWLFTTCPVEKAGAHRRTGPSHLPATPCCSCKLHPSLCPLFPSDGKGSPTLKDAVRRSSVWRFS